MSKVMNGGRAIFAKLEGDTAVPMGIFNSVQWGLTIDAVPIWVLGKFAPVEIEYVGQEPVHVTATGWRVVDHGPHKHGVPNLRDLLNADYMALVVYDRQDPTKRIGVIKQVRATGYSTTVSAKAAEEITVTFMGIFVEDESHANAGNGEAFVEGDPGFPE